MLIVDLPGNPLCGDVSPARGREEPEVKLWAEVQRSGDFGGQEFTRDRRFGYWLASGAVVVEALALDSDRAAARTANVQIHAALGLPQSPNQVGTDAVDGFHHPLGQLLELLP